LRAAALLPSAAATVICEDNCFRVAIDGEIAAVVPDATIDQVAAPDAIFTADVGTPRIWAAPALVDVHTARQELALPPKLTVGQIKGFTLYATRTIQSGRGEELVELGKTNLRELATEMTEPTRAGATRVNLPAGAASLRPGVPRRPPLNLTAHDFPACACLAPADVLFRGQKLSQISASRQFRQRRASGFPQVRPGGG
jgi:hypothetical protein